MENALQQAIKMYAELTNRTAKEVIRECQAGNQVIIESVQMLMFSAIKASSC